MTTELRRAITVVPSAGHLQTGAGPALPEYVFPLDLGRVFRWSPDTNLDDDARTTLEASGGFPGVYIEVRAPDLGADLTSSASQTLTVGGGAWRRIPAATLSANVTLTLSTTNARSGDSISVTREDTGAFTVAFVNDGPALGTLVTMPVSAKSFVKVYFDGTDWVRRESHLMF